jgi:hypothetical protein
MDETTNINKDLLKVDEESTPILSVYDKLLNIINESNSINLDQESIPAISEPEVGSGKSIITIARKIPLTVDVVSTNSIPSLNKCFKNFWEELSNYKTAHDPNAEKFAVLLGEKEYALIFAEHNFDYHGLIAFYKKIYGKGKSYSILVFDKEFNLIAIRIKFVILIVKIYLHHLFLFFIFEILHSEYLDLPPPSYSF